MSVRLLVCYCCHRLIATLEEGERETAPGPRQGQWKHAKRCKPWWTRRPNDKNNRHPTL